MPEPAAVALGKLKTPSTARAPSVLAGIGSRATPTRLLQHNHVARGHVGRRGVIDVVVVLNEDCRCHVWLLLVKK